VYLAEQASPKRAVAIKMLRRAHRTSGAERFLFEAEALARLDHPNITKVLELGTSGDCPFLVMEYVEGVPLDAYAEGEGIDASARVRLMIEVCLGMEHAHGRGVLHRDLSPRNILVTPAGTPKILDFGLAFEMNAARRESLRHTLPGSIMGTLRYICPEQMNSSGAISDVRSDVFSLGVMAFELLGGRHPYLEPGASFGDAVTCLSRSQAAPRFATAGTRGEADLRAVLAKAVEREPERRYPTAAAFADDLARCLDGRPVAAMPAGWWYRTRRFCGRHRAVTAAALVALVSAVAGMGATGLTLRREAQSRASALNALDAVVSRLLSPLGPRIGTLDERERLLADIQTDLEEMHARTPDDPRSVRVYASYLVARGDIARDRARMDDSASNYAAAVRANEHLCRLLPGDPAAGHGLSIAIVKLGDIEAYRGNQGARRDLYLRALRLDEALVEAHPGDLGMLSNLFWSYFRVSEWQDEGATSGNDLAGRLEHVAAQMSALAPDEWRTLEAVAHSSLLRARGMAHTAEHVRLLLKAVSAAERLVARFPDSIVHNATLMTSLMRLLSIREGLIDRVLWDQLLTRAGEVEQVFHRSQGETRFEDVNLCSLARSRYDAALQAGNIEEAKRQAEKALQFARRPVVSQSAIPKDYWLLAEVLWRVARPMARLAGRELQPDEDVAYVRGLASTVVERFPREQEAHDVAERIRRMLAE
jgi:tetratricopeptide (TPR) repeat protein